jgi:phosphotriesterase-related protein
MNRRTFLAGTLGIPAFLSGITCAQSQTGEELVMTVSGPVSAASLGRFLPHEHVLVDFVGADQIRPGRYVREQAFEVILPYLKQLHAAGCRTLAECTPAWLGRDPALLRELTDASGVNLITNTGYYGASGEKYLPAAIKKQTAKEIAAIWIREFREGIDSTGIMPGFIKLGLDQLPFSRSIQKILDAAIETYHETGLTVAIHTSHGGVPAMEELRILKSGGVPADAWIWVHAQNEKDSNWHIRAAEAGGWVEFDGISADSVAEHLSMVQRMKKAGLLNRVLVSQDAGWFHVGEPGGGLFRPYLSLFDQFVPALKNAGFSENDLEQILVLNPAKAFRLRKKLI